MTFSSRGKLLVNLALQKENKAWGCYPAVNTDGRKREASEKLTDGARKVRRLDVDNHVISFLSRLTFL